MIIIEGCDKAGKTTLSRELGRLMGIPVIKNEQEKYAFSQGNFRTVSEGFGYALMQMMLTSDTENRRFIKDRDYPTELVYNLALGIRPNLSRLSEMDTAHAWMGTRIVYCERRNYDVKRYYDEHISYDKIALIKEEYHKFLTYTQCKSMTVYLEDDTPENNALSVVKWLRLL